jgi:hypothetical protein
MHLRPLQILGGTWVLAGLLGMIVFSLYPFKRTLYANSWVDAIRALALGFCSAAILPLGVFCFGTPLLALAVFQVASWVAFVLAVVLSFRIKSPRTGPPGTEEEKTENTSGRWTAIVGTLILALQGFLSLLISEMPGYGGSLGPEATPTALASSLGAVRLGVWICTLSLFATGGARFLILFVEHVRKGGATKLETHWEGIGGGVGGWRMSPSLGYLLVAGVLSLVFIVFLFRFDTREREQVVATTSPTPAPSPAAAAPAR